MSSTTQHDCRICLVTDRDENMIAPCRCAGSIRFVHAECLDQWRHQGPTSSNLTHCPQCLFAYHLQRRQLPNDQHIGLSDKHPLAVALLWLFAQWTTAMALASFVGGFVAKYVLWNDPELMALHFSPTLAWLQQHCYYGCIAALAITGVLVLIRGAILWCQSAPDIVPMAAHHNNNNNTTVYIFNNGGLYHSGGNCGGCNDCGKCDKDAGKIIVFLLVLIAVIFLGFALFVAVYNTVQAEVLRARKRVVKDFTVVDLQHHQIKVE